MEYEDYRPPSLAFTPRRRRARPPLIYNRTPDYDRRSEGSLRRVSSSQDLDVRNHRKRRMRKRIQKQLLKMLLKDDSEEEEIADERRMRKRAQKEALEMMFEDDFEEEDSADDLSDDSQQDESSKILASLAALLSNESESSPTIDKDVQYRAEFYHYKNERYRYRAELQKTVVKENPIDIHPSSRAPKLTDTSCFDVTSMYAVPKLISLTDVAMISEAVLAELGTYITIRSRLLLDILRNTVQYYPTVSFDAEELVLEEPFCVLLHYRNELRERLESAEKAASELGSIGRGDSSIELEHLTDLNNFLNQRYADALSQELLRHQRLPAMCTYEWMWLLFKPGSVVYSWTDGVLEAFVVEEHDRNARQDEDHKIRPREISTLDDLDSTPHQKSLHVTVWYLAFNGVCLGRCREEYSIPRFDGEKPIMSLPIFPHEFMKHEKRVHESLSTQDYLRHRGQLFCELTRRSYRHYEGDTANIPKRTIRERVMVDTKDFLDSGNLTFVEVGFSNGGSSRESVRDFSARPPITGTRRRAGKTDVRFVKRDPEVIGYRYNSEDGKEYGKNKDIYAHYDGVIPDNCDSLESQQYMICAPTIMAFVLKTRQIEELFVDRFSKPVFQVDLMKELVLDSDAKAMVKALSQRYTMHAETNDTWSADFVKNKGEGQIFLLHGKPGVGKTTTAECVAELTRRPLLSLTCGDLGVDPEGLEARLDRWFRLAEQWGAVLLLDEADVYLESRINQDLRRNTLVSIFLRALEYYRGLLFLTSNRVGTFDDAFVSRIHVVIHYPDFTNEKRSQIWDIFFNKLEREKENIKFTQRTVDYAKESKEIQSLGWNGREIRNAFSTAVALAEFENDRDDKKRVIFHARHLEQVVKMSRAFQDYLKSTHGMSQAEQARRYRIRNDYWKGPGEEISS